MDSIIKRDFDYELEQIDWDFVGERGPDSYVSFHWYPARFVPQIPSILIGYFSERGDTVLDPFCGSGTTLLEAFRLDRRPVGIDLHPAAVMMTKAKLLPIGSIRVEKLAEDLTSGARMNLGDEVWQMASAAPASQVCCLDIPNAEENSKWFHPRTLEQLACLYHRIGHITRLDERLVGECCFSSILNRLCSQGRHYGWICDNVQPRQLIYKDAFEAFRSKLHDYERFIDRYETELKTLRPRKVRFSDIAVLVGDSREVLADMPTGSVDLVVTSPPYLNVTDYIRSFRLYMLWFGPLDWASLTHMEIGARSRRSRKTCHSDYIDAMHTCIKETARILKPGKFLCLVIGESSSYAPYSKALLQLCRKEGFEEVHNLTRNIAKQRLLYPRLATESIVIMRRLQQ